MTGRIVTFYSYKGGVGRSFALANVAAILSGWGYRVLCVDWDLDAPGLSYYFAPGLDGQLAGGIVDAFADFAKGGPLDLGRFITAVRLPGSQARFDFLPAGSGGPDYPAKTQGLDWSALYAERELGDHLEKLRAGWMSTYDMVLIDSRTGITDIGGICTAQLPDVLVMLFTANRQSLAGTLDVAARAERARDKLPYDRPRLMIAPVPSRFDAKEEFRRAEEWRETFARELAGLVAPWLHREVTVATLLSHVTIPYIPYWSFGEEIAVGHGESAPGDITYILTTLAALLAHGLSKTELLGDSRDSYVSAGSRGPESRPAERFSHDVLLCYEKENDFGQGFADLLGARDLRVLTWTSRDQQGAPASIQEIVAQCRHCVLVLDQETARQTPRAVEVFVRQSLDDGPTRQVFQVAPADAGSAGAHSSRALSHSDIIPARTPDETGLAASRIVGEIMLIAAQEALAAAIGHAADAQATRPAYTDVVASFLFLGQVAQAQGALSEALSRYSEALAAATQGGFAVGEASALVGLGEVSLAQGAPEKAITHYQDAIERFRRIGYTPVTADILFKLGDAYRALGQVDRAGKSYQGALAEYRANPDQGDPRRRHQIFAVTISIGDVAAAAGDYADAFARYGQALEVTDVETADCEADLASRHDRYLALVRLGDVALIRGELELARSHLRDAAGIADVFAAETPDNVQAALDQADVHDRLGLTYVRLGDWPSARREFGTCLAVAQVQAAADPSSQEWHARLAGAHGRLAAVSGSTGDLVVAQQHYEARLGIVSALAAADPSSSEWSRELMLSHMSLGDVTAAMGDTPSALSNYQLAIAIAQRMAMTDRSSYSQWEVDVRTLRQKISDIQPSEATN